MNEAIDSIKEIIKNDIYTTLSSDTNSTITSTTVNLDLTSEDTNNYSIQLRNTAEATLRYSYSTDNANNVLLSYYGNVNARTKLELSPATEDVYYAI